MAEKLPRYMMATTAIHKMGDISRDKPDICLIHSEDDDAFIGHWVTGFGFIYVQFPKATTRELTKDEIAYYHGRRVGGCMNYTLDITDED